MTIKREPKRLEVIIGDPLNPELRTVTTVDYFLETVELLNNPPHRYSAPLPLLTATVKKESPTILRISSKYKLERERLRIDYEEKIRLTNIAENEEIEKAKIATPT